MSVFTIVVIPDTQKLTSNTDTDDYNDLIQYIVDQKDARNIKMVIHTGDTVDDGGDSGMNAMADTALAKLDGEIPYLIGIGNKDYDDGGGSSRTATGFNSNFPLSNYQTYDWFIDDVYPTGETVNTSAKITVGDYTYLFINIEFLPRASAINWAKNIADTNTDADLIIVNSHFVLDSDGERASDSEVSDLWDEFLSVNPKIQLVLSGHVAGPQRRTDDGVHQHLNNEQNESGNDYFDSATLRFYEIDQSDHSVSVTTYNPLTDTQLTDSGNQFTFNFSVTPSEGGEEGGDIINESMASYTATVTSAKVVGGSHSNFPAFIDLSSLSLSSAEANSIRVYSDSGLTTELAREIIGTTGIFVKIASLSTSTVVYIEIDGTSSDYSVTDTYGRNNVWSAYLAVSHAIGTDSTGNGLTFNAGGGATLGGATGVAGSASAFDGATEFAKMTYDASLNFGTGDAMMQIIFKSPNASALQHLLVYGDRDNWTSADSFATEVKSDNAFNAKIRPSGSGEEVSGGTFSVDTWYKMTVIADRDGNMNLIINGSSVGTVSISSLAGGSLNSTIGIYIACNNGESVFAELTACEFRIRNAIHSTDWETTEYNNMMDNGAFWTLEGDSTDYPITIGTGSFTLTGIATAFSLGRLISAVKGTFTLTGQAVTLSFGRMMATTAGAFTLAGQNVTLLFGKAISCAVGSFTLTGQDASLTSVRSMIASAGSFTLTGVATAFKLGMKVIASAGSFTLTGVAVTFGLGKGMIASAGSFTLTGVATAFDLSRGIVASVGSFILTGVDVVLKPSNIWFSTQDKNDVDWTNQSKS